MTTQPDARRFGLSPKGRSAAVIGAAFVIPFLVYLRTLAPTIVGGDTGELTTAAWLRAQNDPAAEPPREARLGFGVEQPLLYGVVPLAPTPPGRHYEEMVHYVAAHDLSRGPYAARAALHLPEGKSAPVVIALIDVEKPR